MKQCQNESHEDFVQRRRASNNAYNAAHRERLQEQQRGASKRYRERYPERSHAAANKWKTANPEYAKAATNRLRALLRKEVFGAYGGQCACCGEKDMHFFSIDHINGGGNAHRRSLGVWGGVQFYRWLKKQGFPPGYQVLCHNCNMAKAFYGSCPHQAPTSSS